MSHKALRYHFVLHWSGYKQLQIHTYGSTSASGGHSTTATLLNDFINCRDICVHPLSFHCVVKTVNGLSYPQGVHLPSTQGLIWLLCLLLLTEGWWWQTFTRCPGYQDISRQRHKWSTLIRSLGKIITSSFLRWTRTRMHWLGPCIERYPLMFMMRLLLFLNSADDDDNHGRLNQ